MMKITIEKEYRYSPDGNAVVVVPVGEIEVGNAKGHIPHDFANRAIKSGYAKSEKAAPKNKMSSPELNKDDALQKT